MFGEPEEILDFDDSRYTIGTASLLTSAVSQLQPMQQLRKVANSAANKVFLDGRQRHQYLSQNVLNLIVLIGLMVQLLVVKFEARR